MPNVNIAYVINVFKSRQTKYCCFQSYKIVTCRQCGVLGLEEMERRREKQQNFNIENNITPLGINKAVADIMEGGYSAGRPGGRKKVRVADDSDEYRGMSAEAMMKKVKQLEEQMYRHARDLEFEEAAAIRDRIKKIQTEGLGIPESQAG